MNDSIDDVIMDDSIDDKNDKPVMSNFHLLLHLLSTR